MTPQEIKNSLRDTYFSDLISNRMMWKINTNTSDIVKKFYINPNDNSFILDVDDVLLAELEIISGIGM